jgi:cell division protein FtsL
MNNISLHRLILSDWRHSKLQVVLLLACIGSALVVVHFAHLNRQLTIAHDGLYQQRDQLDIEWRNLVLEQRSLSEHSRVEDIARNRLQMIRPAGDRDIAVTVP